jgi:triosephosphate isomerase
MKKLILGNWKMQKLFSDIHPYFKVFKHKSFSTSFQIGIAAPSIYIKPCLEEMNNTPFIIGAQNVSEHSNGAFTGEISAEMLASMPVSFCLVGHSERRKFFNENSSLVLKKAKKLQEMGILPIVCIGETLEEKKNFKQVLKNQLEGIFSLDPKNLVLAYEPVWAIGTGKTASSEDILEVHDYIKSFLKEGSYDFSQLQVLYGGSVNESNAASIVNLAGVDGLLIGGASLDPVGFEKLISTLS